MKSNSVSDFEKLNHFLLRFRILVKVGREIWRFVCFLCRPWIIRSYLKSHDLRKLQLGAATNFLDGWLNTDLTPKSPRIAFINAKKPFPFKDRTFDYILCEHLIEHLTYSEGLLMLRDSYRILKPRGRIRINTPNLDVFISLFVPEKSDLQQRYVKWVVDKFLPETGVYRECFVMNNVFSAWGHRFIYDYITLRSALEEVGFVDISQYAPGESSDPNLKGVESHGDVVGDEEMNRFETLVLEAIRPQMD